MGEARRRASQGLPPRQTKNKTDTSPRIVSWLPITQNQKEKFYSTTKLGAWIGIGFLIIFWIVLLLL